jgi:nucleotide-binding universal stress UspA family protein
LWAFRNAVFARVTKRSRTMNECIVAYTGEGERYWPLIEKSIDLAKARSARLIFYDADAASMFANPLPTWWSADGEEEQFPTRLTPEHLEKAGQEELQRRVEHARGLDVDAYGWLPSKRDAEALAEYAEEQHATLIVVPSSLDERGLKDWIQGRPSGEDVAEATHQPVVTVELEPEAAKA